jgi:serine/threonine protein kinase
MKESEGKKELKNDMTSDMLLREIYTINGKLQKKYLTINTDLKYESFYFTGIIVTVKRHKYYYYISNRCQLTLDKLDSLDIKQLILNYLESFKILHSKEYYHGDVKPQNMMYCSLEKTDVKYKLIDWGRMYNVHVFDPLYYYGGSKQMGCPLGFYFMFRNISRQQIGVPMGSNIAVQMTFDLIEGNLPLNPIKNPLLIEDKYKSKFKPLWKKIKLSFEKMISFYTKDGNLLTNSIKNDTKIFNKYRFTMDLYNLGLTCLYLMYKHNIENEKYILWIEKLVCYNENMITDTESVIKEFKLINKTSN